LRRNPTTETNTATIGFEAKLWLTAASRSAAETAQGNRSNNMDAAEPSEANQVERDSLHEVQRTKAGAAAHGKQTAKASPRGKRGGVHQFGVPPKGNANFAWVQHFIHHLAPQGMAGFVLANGSMSSNQSGEKETWLPS
jgi:hypothetical protein